MTQRTRFEASLGPVPTTGSSTQAQLNRALNQTSVNVACVFGELCLGFFAAWGHRYEGQLCARCKK